MNILFYGQGLASDDWLDAIRTALPQCDVRLWSTRLETGWQADYALLWHPPVELFAQQKNLKAIFNLGAGVDALLRLPGRPDDVPVIKLRNAGMDPWMFDYIHYGVLHFGRNFDHYRRQQQQQLWQPHPSPAPNTRCIGILGLGALGQTIAQRFSLLGYRVQGWSRGPKSIEGIDTYSGLEHLDGFLGRCDVLVNLLPATAQTDNLLDAERLARLRHGAVLINAGRGTTLDLDALNAALASGQLRGALLDVFPAEPLPADHPLWSRPDVIITPHIAAPTLIDEALEQITADIASLEQGLYVPRVDSTLGY
ncbi:2-hydroxyacid dehydrogenase [Marinobacterium rhizophilum]|uniref:Glyoxylate/hydroxypyruvate reductase A n=1 Tax=Marinobacterium rhizophilum TaxID=420402 RepID=A0ABY5HPS8_9GAMM|nr:glyoxylate/hydroxypyruvate reductase A [Marinobacterium rhizophilum]UTW13886.1 glyoxylate/hydroxypyruvate reductase A [Marinobacterium rhizophilum]